MTVQQILRPIIQQELDKYQQHGQKVRLKSAAKRRLKHSAICLPIALVLLPAPPLAIITLIVYICLMCKTKNVDIIFWLAAKNPDTPIDQIVAQEVKP